MVMISMSSNDSLRVSHKLLVNIMYDFHDLTKFRVDHDILDISYTSMNTVTITFGSEASRVQFYIMYAHLEFDVEW